MPYLLQHMGLQGAAQAREEKALLNEAKVIQKQWMRLREGGEARGENPGGAARPGNRIPKRATERQLTCDYHSAAHESMSVHVPVSAVSISTSHSHKPTGTCTTATPFNSIHPNSRSTVLTRRRTSFLCLRECPSLYCCQIHSPSQTAQR